jgi:hypothetical protein
MRVRTRFWVLLAFVVLLATAGGIAYATIPGGDGVIHGCYTNRGGVLTVIDPAAGQTCSSLQTPISWNQQGPQGPQGPQGAPGPQGDPGAAGPSDAYVTAPTGSECCPQLGAEYVRVAGLNLPSGDFTIDANISFFNSEYESQSILVTCYIDSPFGGNVGTALASISGSVYSVGSMHVSGSTRLLVDGTVSLYCDAFLGLGPDAPTRLTSQYITLEATKVGELHRQ